MQIRHYEEDFQMDNMIMANEILAFEKMKLRKCKICKETFKPTTDYVESRSLVEAVERYTMTVLFCPECLRELDHKICDSVIDYLSEKDLFNYTNE